MGIKNMIKEIHYAYRITNSTSGLVCTYSEFEEDKMIDLLLDIKKSAIKDIFWVFKKRDSSPEEPICIIDGPYNRIYFHYSGEVEQLDDVIKKLTKTS